jgi:hypothetical protein
MSQEAKQHEPQVGEVWKHTTTSNTIEVRTVSGDDGNKRITYLDATVEGSGLVNDVPITEFKQRFAFFVDRTLYQSLLASVVTIRPGQVWLKQSGDDHDHAFVDYLHPIAGGIGVRFSEMAWTGTHHTCTQRSLPLFEFSSTYWWKESSLKAPSPTSSTGSSASTASFFPPNQEGSHRYQQQQLQTYTPPSTASSAPSVNTATLQMLEEFNHYGSAPNAAHTTPSLTAATQMIADTSPILSSTNQPTTPQSVSSVSSLAATQQMAEDQ